jgi:hypothetical protein
MMIANLKETDSIAKRLSEMNHIELALVMDQLFKLDQDKSEWIARDLDVRAMDKAICESQLAGEFND